MANVATLEPHQCGNSSVFEFRDQHFALLDFFSLPVRHILSKNISQAAEEIEVWTQETQNSEATF